MIDHDRSVIIEIDYDQSSEKCLIEVTIETYEVLDKMHHTKMILCCAAHHTKFFQFSYYFKELGQHHPHEKLEMKEAN